LTDRDRQHDKRIRDNVRRRDVRQRESLKYRIDRKIQRETLWITYCRLAKQTDRKKEETNVLNQRGERLTDRRRVKTEGKTCGQSKRGE
jgi:hypothetical protein